MRDCLHWEPSFTPGSTEPHELSHKRPASLTFNLQLWLSLPSKTQHPVNPSQARCNVQTGILLRLECLMYGKITYTCSYGNHSVTGRRGISHVCILTLVFHIAHSISTSWVTLSEGDWGQRYGNIYFMELTYNFTLNGMFLQSKNSKVHSKTHAAT